MNTSYESLLQLGQDWQKFERPQLLNGAPDYTEAYQSKAYNQLEGYQDRLNSFDVSSWPIAQQVDWHLLRAQMNGFDFDHRVLKPWVRDPAFYQTVMTEQSDVPTQAGPVHDAILDLWTYQFPLTATEQGRLIQELAVIPPLSKQAQKNLTGNAKDLWLAGIRNIQAQSMELNALKVHVQSTKNIKLLAAIDSAIQSTDELAVWLTESAPEKTGPSGVGKDNYTWYQQNVHYVPYSWEEEVTLLKRELARAWSSLKQEEQHNRGIPMQEAASTEEELNIMAEQSATRMITFLADNNIMTVEDYFEPELREHLTTFVPADERNFFSIVAHHDPLPLLTHSYHWIDMANAARYPNSSTIRQGPLPYNIYDNRSEGIATAVEEIFMNAGLYDDNPRSRELIWILLAQRAARGLGSLYAHANMMDMAEAGTVHMNWTPRKWMGNEPNLLQYEQQLYLRQPGYGTSYMTGKFLIDNLLATRTKQMEGEDYGLTDFFDELNSVGIIPVSLTHWQLTGDATDIEIILPNLD